MANELMAPQRGVMAREEFGATQQHQSGDTAMAAVAAREQAMVQARFIMAERHPRDWDTVRVRLLKHCDRPGFAEKAWYKKPTGRTFVNNKWVDTTAEDVSVRFAEVARQEIGNLDITTTVTYEDANTRIVTATVFDLQKNNRDSRDIVVNKVTEKRGKKLPSGEWDPPEGRDIISQRLNSKGEPVYVCRATEDEIRSRVNSEISKAQREETKRLIPVDILDDCRARIKATNEKEDKRDPQAARKKVIDAFAGLEVMPDELANYLGHPIEKSSPAEVDELRGLFTAIKDGEISMSQAIRAKFDQPPGSADDRDAVVAQKIAEQTAALKRQAEQEGSIPSGASTVAGVMPGNGPKGSGEQASQSRQPEAPLSEEEMKAGEQRALEQENRAVSQSPRRRLQFGKQEGN